MSSRTRRARPLALLAAGLSLGFPTAGAAASYQITTLAEDVLDNGNCTLREALLAASTSSSHGGCLGDVGPDTIVLTAVGSYELDDGNLSLTARSLTVAGDPAQPASAYVVDLGNTQRFLALGTGSALTLRNLTLRAGDAGSGNGGAVSAEDSDLTLDGVVVESCAADNGGAIWFRTFTSRGLEIAGSTFSGNGALGDQAYGGAVRAELQGSGSVRILSSSFLDNRIDSADGDFGRRGAGIAIEDYGGGAVELRHLAFERNVIDAPSFGSGAGAYLYVAGGTTSLLVEDVLFEANEIVVDSGTNASSALQVTVDAPQAALRRLRLLDNLGTPGRYQASIQVQGATPLVVSDLLVVDGDGAGLFLETAGTTCGLTAGNLTVAGHPDDGLTLSEGACSLRLENSIVFGNDPNVNLLAGNPEISSEVLLGVDPGFVDAPAGDYRLGPASVAADAGEAGFASVGPFDAAHGPRVEGSELDLGALERDAVFADDFEHGDPLAWGDGPG